jgi:hypothetical protein
VAPQRPQLLGAFTSLSQPFAPPGAPVSHDRCVASQLGMQSPLPLQVVIVAPAVVHSVVQFPQ